MKNYIILSLVLLTFALPLSASIYWYQLGERGTAWTETEKAEATPNEAQAWFVKFGHIVSYNKERNYSWQKQYQITRIRGEFPFYINIKDDSVTTSLIEQ